MAQLLADVRWAQGLLLGRLTDVGMALRDQASLSAFTEDVLKTSEIEGAQLNAQSVRPSIARCLGVDIGALAPADQTNLRDQSDLLARGVLRKTEGGRCSAGYALNTQFQ